MGVGVGCPAEIRDRGGLAEVPECAGIGVAAAEGRGGGVEDQAEGWTAK